MLNKTMIALSAVAVLASASATFAADEPEHRLSDLYPFLEQGYKPIPKAIASRHIATGQTRGYAEEPEHRLTDLYPFLEPGYKRIAAASRKVAPQLSNNQLPVEEPEHKLSDLYPFLEPAAKARAAFIQTDGRMHQRAQRHTMKRQG